MCKFTQFNTFLAGAKSRPAFGSNSQTLKNTSISGVFVLYFVFFPSFFTKKEEKRRFRPANGVRSTRSLVEIYNIRSIVATISIRIRIQIWILNSILYQKSSIISKIGQIWSKIVIFGRHFRYKFLFTIKFNQFLI